MAPVLKESAQASYEPDLSLEEAVRSKTYRMRLTAVWVDTKKEAVGADETVSMNANIMKEDIDKYAELTEVQGDHGGHAPRLG